MVFILFSISDSIGELDFLEWSHGCGICHLGPLCSSGRGTEQQSGVRLLAEGMGVPGLQSHPTVLASPPWVVVASTSMCVVCGPRPVSRETLSYQWNFCGPEFLLGWAETSMGGETGSEDENSVTSKILLVCSGQGGLLKGWWGATPGPPTERAG